MSSFEPIFWYIWSCSNKNENDIFTKTKYFKKNWSSFPQNKGRTMKFMRCVAWGIRIIRVYIFFQMCWSRLIIILLHFFSKAACFFRKIFFQYVYPDLLRPIFREFTEYLHVKDFEIWNMKYCGSDLRHYGCLLNI